MYKNSLLIYSDSSASSYQLHLVRNAILEKVRASLPSVKKVIIKTGSK